MNLKAWIDDKIPRFFYLQPIQYIGVMEFGAKAVRSNAYPEIANSM